MERTQTPINCFHAPEKLQTGKMIKNFLLNSANTLTRHTLTKISSPSTDHTHTSSFVLFRRAYLDRFLKNRGNIKLISTSTSPILGIEGGMTSENDKLRDHIEKCYREQMQEINKHTHQSFIPEKTASPHPRFLGLAKSIYERREKKVEIKVPLYQDE